MGLSLEHAETKKEMCIRDRPTSGEVFLNGKNIVSINEKEISAFRRDNIGFVFQDFNLLDTFSIKDNILLPLVLAGKSYEMCIRDRYCGRHFSLSAYRQQVPVGSQRR